jgi:SOS-response transcriptional repressor LexA
MEDFYDRVKALAKLNKITIEGVANYGGISIDSYNSYRIHGTLPRADAAMKMAEALNTTLDYLVYGEGEISTIKGKFFVPVLNQKLSAGRGQPLQDEPELCGYMEVPRNLRHYGEKLAVLYVEGDSMEPTLRRGDLVLCNSCGYEGEGLYAIQYDGDAYVKRVFKQSGNYVIKSDNPLYPLREEPIGSENIAVVGRVLYIVKKCD